MTEATEFATFVRLHSTVLLRSAFLMTGSTAAAEVWCRTPSSGSTRAGCG